MKQRQPKGHQRHIFLPINTQLSRRSGQEETPSRCSHRVKRKPPEQAARRNMGNDAKVRQFCPVYCSHCGPHPLFYRILATSTKLNGSSTRLDIRYSERRSPPASNLLDFSSGGYSQKAKRIVTVISLFKGHIYCWFLWDKNYRTQNRFHVFNH